MVFGIFRCADRRRHPAHRARRPAARPVRVGVYVGNHSPEAGGGFTIVNELLAALRAQEAPSAHEFVILTTSDSWKDETPAALEVVSLRDAVLKSPTVNRVEAK